MDEAVRGSCNKKVQGSGFPSHSSRETPPPNIMASNSEGDSLPTPPPIPENITVPLRRHSTHVMDTRSTSRNRQDSSYFAMLGNITSDLNNLLTDLCPHPRDDPHHTHPGHRDEGRNKSSTIHSEDTLGKDSFLSSAGNTSRTRGNHVGSDPSLASSLDHTDHCDCDSVDSGHDGRCRSGPSPLVFDPNHFGRPSNATGSVTLRVDVSSSMEESRTISALERLVKTNSIWLLSSLSRAGAVHLLKDRCTGTFIVRKSSQPNSLALSVQNRLNGLPTVDHYLIEGRDYGFRLQGSSHFFQSVPQLISFYIENREDIPYLLQLPPSIQDSRSLRELASLSLLGQDFWQSPISRRSPTPSFEGRIPIHKSCSEPIDIQTPFYPSAPSDVGSRLMVNTLPCRSPTEFTNFAQTQSNFDRYFEQQKISHASSGDLQSGSGLSNIRHNVSQIQPPDSSTINIVRQTISINSSHSQSTKTTITNHHHPHHIPCPESTPPFPVNIISTPQSHSRESLTQFGSHSSITQSHQRLAQKSQNGQPVHISASSMASTCPIMPHPATNSSNQIDRLESSAANLSGSSVDASCQTPCAISAPNVETLVPDMKQPVKRRSLTHPRDDLKPKSSLYSTMNLGLLEIPENSYFKSNLSDKLSDYEDVWKNNCDSDVPYVSRKIQDPRSVLESRTKTSRNNRHNPMFAKDGRRKVFKKTVKDTKPSRERQAQSPRDSVTGGRTGLTALERARLIAGSTSDEDSAPVPPIAHVKGIQRMENIFNDTVFDKSEPENVTTSSLTTVSDLSPMSTSVSDNTVVKETCIGSVQFSNSSSPHQFKLITSHSLDFSQQSAYKETQSLSLSRIDSPPSKCVFTTTMSVLLSETASGEDVSKATNPKLKHIPGPLTNMSKIKSSSESSLATVSSPLYLEPADAVKLRDRDGKPINIHVRRRSAPSAPHQFERSLPSKVSQQTPLETIFSPNEANALKGHSSVQPKFVFDNICIDNISPNKATKSKPAITRSLSSRSAQENNSNLQRKHSWKDRINRLKLGTKVLTQNLTPPGILNNRNQSPPMAKQKPTLENLTLNDSEGHSKDNTPSPAFSSPGPFPLDINSSHPTRASIFSETSTIQDLISSTHPELAVRPIVPQAGRTGHNMRIRGGPPLSEYDNLAGYRGSTHSSQGTIYCPPWESTRTHKLIQPNRPDPKPNPPQQFPPAMDLNERVKRWQIANSKYQESDMNDSQGKNIGHRNKSESSKKSSSSRTNASPGKLNSKGQCPNNQSVTPKLNKSKGKSMSISPESPEILDDDLHITESHDIKPSSEPFINAVHHQNGDKATLVNDCYDNFASSHKQLSKSANTPLLSHQQSVDSSSSFHPAQSKSPTPKGTQSSPTPLSSHHPDVVNCHHARPTQFIPALGQEFTSCALIQEELQGHEEEDILLGGAMANVSNDLNQKIKPVLNHTETGQGKGSRTAGSKIREYIFRLSGDNKTMFGSTIGNFIQCTIESQETNPLHVMRNVRQFMTGIKNYLVKHGEGQLEDMIERERAKLSANEILNIDAIIEQALHVCVLKPLKTHIYKLFVNHYSQNGALQKLSRNIKYARSRSAQELGVKPGLKLPNASDMEVIGHHLNLMQKSYSPLQKLSSLLKATSTIYHCVQGKELLPSRGPMSLGADDFLPMLIFVIVHSGLVAAEIEADFMWGLLQPSLLTGEGGYYLTTLSSAVLVLKNFQDTHQLTYGQIEVRLPAISDMQGFLKIAIPNETQGSISWKTLPVRPSMNTRDVCAMVAHKFKVTNPQAYGLFLLCDGEENQMAELDCPQLVKGDLQAKNKDCYFAFKRVDATIAWPHYMKHSPVTVLED